MNTPNATEKQAPQLLVAMVFAQNAVIAALMSSRLNPERFEQDFAAARASMRVAAIMQGGPDAGKEYDEVFDLYLAMLQSGDPNADSKDAKY